MGDSNFIFKGYSSRLDANILVTTLSETEEEITIAIHMSSTYDGGALDHFEVAIPREGFLLVVKEDRVVSSIEDAYLEIAQGNKTTECQQH